MKTLLAAFFICFSSVVCGQVNLVPNPSFEISDTCPYNVGQIRFARPWFQPNEPQNIWSSSTDYFNACGQNNFGVPYNIAGFQYARTGSAYIGFGPYSSTVMSGGNELLEVGLDSSLNFQENYCIHFYLNHVTYNLSCASTSAISVYLSTDTCQYSSVNWSAPPFIPQLTNDSGNYIIDTLNWHELKWIYNSTGGEKFITIGNFNSPATNSLYSYDACTGGSSTQAPYYFIDDVSVVKLPKLEAGRDTTIISSEAATLNGNITETWPGMQFEWLPHTGLSNPYSLTPVAFPNTTTTYTLTVSCPTCNVPCLEDLRDTATITVNAVPPPPTPLFNIPTLIGAQPFFITTLAPGTHLTIYNLLGQLLFETDNYQNNLWPELVWEEGMYLYELVQPDGTRMAGKFCLVQ